MAGVIIDEPSTVQAWATAASYVYGQGPLPTFMAVSAGHALPSGGGPLAQYERIAAINGAERPNSVATVLFPEIVQRTPGTTSAKIQAGLRLFGRGRRRNKRYSGWRHTYFERLTGQWMDRDLVLRDIKQNRLLSVIEKINRWDRDIEAGFYAHTDAPSDTLRMRGSPCLQYVQFRLFDGDQIELYALYRAHDYFNKALGNMIGLQRLGEFVAAQTGRSFVKQTVFSLHPFSSASKQDLRGFVEAINAI